MPGDGLAEPLSKRSDFLFIFYYSPELARNGDTHRKGRNGRERVMAIPGFLDASQPHDTWKISIFTGTPSSHRC